MTLSARMARLGRAGGLRTRSLRDPVDYTRKARASFLARFEAEVDPHRLLSELERLRRAEAARRLFFVRLAHKSAERRAKRSRSRTRRPEEEEP